MLLGHKRTTAGSAARFLISTSAQGLFIGEWGEEEVQLSGSSVREEGGTMTPLAS